MRVSVFGVRGSTPCSCASNHRYGGNTSCVVVEGDGFEPIILDLGTGLRFWGLSHGPSPLRATALVSHLHWDHVQGLPFFTPLHREGSSLKIFGPPQESTSLEQAFDEFLCPPYFPVRLSQLAGEVTFEEASDAPFTLGDAVVTSRLVPHLGPTLGFRIEAGGSSLAYVSDHQQPLDDASRVDPGVLELCEGVDLLIHDSQYTQAEFEAKSDWGHCTVEYAIEVARQSGAKCLMLFHHDPSHDDTIMDALLVQAKRTASSIPNLEVIGAREGMVLQLGPEESSGQSGCMSTGIGCAAQVSDRTA